MKTLTARVDDDLWHAFKLRCVTERVSQASVMVELLKHHMAQPAPAPAPARSPILEQLAAGEEF